MIPSNNPRTQRVSDAAFAALVVAILGISAWVHALAGFTLPFPWNDESMTLFPARNMAEHQRLFSPEMNPEKVIFCYPVQDALLGVMTMALGPGLGWARHLSWVWTALSLVLLALWLRRAPGRFVLLGVAGWFYVSAPLVVAGNIVRPEAMMLAIFAALLVAAKAGRPWMVGACGVLAASLHPAGAIGAGFASLGAAWMILRTRPRPDRYDLAVLALAALAAGYFAQVVVRHWADIREWFLATSSEPMTQDAASILSSPWLVLFLGLHVVFLAWAAWRDRSMVIPVLLGCGVALIPAIRTQMWYDSYRAWTVLLTVLNGACLIGRGLVRIDRPSHTLLRAVMHHVVAAAAALPLLWNAYGHGWLEGPRGYPRELQWGWGMRMGDPDVPYYREQDREALEAALRGRIGDTAYRLSMLSEADSILMWRGLGRHLFYQQVRTPVEPDLVIIHDSRYKPDWVRDIHRSRTEASHRFAGVLHERDDTERWTLWVKPHVTVSANPP